MSKRRKYEYEAHVLVSVPAGEIDANSPREALEKLMRTKMFHHLRSQSTFDTVRVMMIKKETRGGTIYSIPKLPTKKVKKELTT